MMKNFGFEVDFSILFIQYGLYEHVVWEARIYSTFERDIPNLGIRVAPHTLRRFWMMLLSLSLACILNTVILIDHWGFLVRPLIIIWIFYLNFMMHIASVV